jgi:cell shape-determining protein MreC
VFIVVLTVFAIAFSMLVIGYAAQSQNYRELADTNHAWALENQAQLQSNNSLTRVTEENYQKQIADLQAQLTKMQGTMDANANQMGTVKNELLAEQQKTASLTGQVTQLTSMISAGDAERKQLQSQLENMRKDNSGLRTDNFKLAETNQKLDLQRQLYEQEIRLLKEQNFSLSERVEELRSKVQAASTGEAQPGETAAKGGAQSISDSAGSAIVGEIKEIRGNLACLTIGSAQGVKNGMELIIYRGSQYLGKVIINKVQPEQSAGELAQMQGNIVAGDKVTDKF